MMKKTLLFDLDGTLTDPKEGITNSVAYALQQAGIKDVDKEALTTFIGPPLADSFAQYYGFDEKQCESAIAQYRVYFKARGMLENVVYPGIAEMLQDLKEAGFKLFVATSKPRVFAIEILQHFQLDAYFDGIYGSELDGTRSHKAEVIAYAIAQEKLQKTDCVMIGDRKHDILGAKENELASIGVLFGYGDVKELQEAGADCIVDSVMELEKLFVSGKDRM